tara:strand:+ start:4202 stop:4489 length:288 start_codon:yes stop_codon:yes gene_type:complete
MQIVDQLIQSIPNMGSMDKSLNQERLSPNFIKTIEEAKSLRSGYESGGPADPIDQEILELEMFVGLRPLNSYEASLIEQMKDRLSYLYSVKKGDQ